MKLNPPINLGIGWRPEIALDIHRRDSLDFIEILAENSDTDAVVPPIRQLQQRGVQVIVHGTGLSLGGAEHPDPKRLDLLNRLAKRFDAPLISEHIAFVRAKGIEAGHLIPVARTRESLKIVVENVREAQAALCAPLALENISALLDWPENELTESEFLNEILDQTDAMLLLDLANVYANCHNLGGDEIEFLKELPLSKIAYVHIGGGEERNGRYYDTHSHQIADGVLGLLEELCTMDISAGVMLERDDDFPPTPQLYRELDAIAAARRRGRERKEPNRSGRTTG